MLKKKEFYIGTLILGVILLILSFALRGFVLKSVSGVLIGIGAGLFGMSISNLFMKRFEKRNPEIAKAKEIEFKDERNEMIRNKAKGRAGDIIQWFIMGIAYLMIIIDAPLWVTLTVICVFVLYNVLTMHYTSKYQKEM